MLGRDRLTASGSGYLYITVNNLSNNKFSYSFTHAVNNKFYETEAPRDSSSSKVSIGSFMLSKFP
jgi:hypothetical protein